MIITDIEKKIKSIFPNDAEKCKELTALNSKEIAQVGLESLKGISADEVIKQYENGEFEKLYEMALNKKNMHQLYNDLLNALYEEKVKNIELQ